jgi:hypothetical protein
LLSIVVTIDTPDAHRPHAFRKMAESFWSSMKTVPSQVN